MINEHTDIFEILQLFREGRHDDPFHQMLLAAVNDEGSDDNGDYPEDDLILNMNFRQPSRAPREDPANQRSRSQRREERKAQRAQREE